MHSGHDLTGTLISNVATQPACISEKAWMLKLLVRSVVPLSLSKLAIQSLPELGKQSDRILIHSFKNNSAVFKRFCLKGHFSTHQKS
jgi:hypothetical protein